MKKYILAHPWILTFSTVTGVLFNVAMIFSSLFIGVVVDEMLSGDLSSLFSMLWIAVLLVLSSSFFVWLSARMFFAYHVKSYKTLASDFFSRILDKSISDFNQENSARYISMLNNDIKTISNSYFSSVAQFSSDIFGVLFAFVTIFIISPVNAFLLLLAGALPLVGPILFSSRMSRTQMEQSKASVSLNQIVKDYLSGFEVIKTFKIENSVLKKFNAGATKLMKTMFRSGAAVSDSGAITAMIILGVTYASYFVAGYFVMRGRISVGDVVAIISLGSYIISPMTVIANHMNNFSQVKEISKNILEIMEQTDNTVREVVLSDFKNEVVFKDVNFKYDTDTEDVSLALKNVNFNFKKGKKYAIVGQSGSGKSTLTKLLLGYYDNYEGSVTIDGHDVCDIERNSLYTLISALHQNVFLLDDTLKNNITLYNDYPEEDYSDALRKANLSHVVEALMNGSETLLGEGGNTVSGGERQRISIARSLLKGSEILILDEATANLDNITGFEIESTILDMERVTCIFVTHKYSKELLSKCDSILVMKNGELIEQGGFDELYESKGHFYALFSTHG